MATTEYPKINAPFYRDMTKPGNPLIPGKWSEPEFDYLQHCEWEFAEKVDGTNIRVELLLIGVGDENTLSVKHKGRTDNANIPPHLLLHLEKVFPNAPMWRRDLAKPPYTARHSEIKQWMIDNELEKVVLYGEGYGPKINGGGRYRDDASFVLFDVKIGDFWLTRDNVNDIAKKLKIESVPVVGYGTLNQGVEMVRRGLDSIWGDFEAEGVVARPAIPLFNRKGNRITTKIKARDFK